MGSSQYRSVPDMFLSRVKATPDRRAFQYPVGDGWAWLSWQDAGDRVRRIASGLASLGIGKEERCAILSSTRVEWILADLGILCAAGATTTVYPSNTPEECEYILTDSATVVVFAEDDKQVAKLVEVRDKLPLVKQVITFEGAAGHDGWVITLAELEATGQEYDEAHAGEYEKIANGVQSDDLATLIYTSGTTGKPKGVELTQDCWVYEGWAIDSLGIVNLDDHQYLWLPLSHSFGKVLEAAQLHIGFPTTVDGRIPKLVENLGVVRPTFMAAAPRIFEKVYNKVVSGAQQAGGLKYKIFTWSLGVGRQVSALRQQRKEPTGFLALKFKIATKLVFSKLQARFGGQLRFFISGSAPLSREMAEFFHAADILIIEGYGLTESSAATFVNRPDTFKFGTVGEALPQTEVKIAPEDGEILIKGRGIMRGYHNRAEATAETLTEDGWLRTGDIGELDDKNRLRITDRKKDLIKTSGGKYVAPQSIEGKLKAQCPYIGNVLVHGDRRNFCTALITVDEEGLTSWKTDVGLGSLTYEELTQHAKVNEMIQEAIDRLNATLARYETIKKFAILPKEWTVEDGELTASMKVKRKVVEQRHASILDGFYEGALL